MPEAPTIILLCEKTKQFIGQKVLSIEGSVEDAIKDKLRNSNVISARTFGKQLLLLFPDFTISIHLMLFGSFTFNFRKPAKLTLGLRFKEGELNFYASKIKLIEEPLDEVFDWRTEVMNERFDEKLALEKLKAEPKELIGDALLNQDIFAGVGNKIKDEVLFRLKVHPLSRVADIPDKKLKELIEDCITYSFQQLEWKREGVADEHLLIHYQEECPRDEVPVRKEKIGKTGRTSYFCDKCMTLYS